MKNIITIGVTLFFAHFAQAHFPEFQKEFSAYYSRWSKAKDPETKRQAYLDYVFKLESFDQVLIEHYLAGKLEGSKAALILHSAMIRQVEMLKVSYSEERLEWALFLQEHIESIVKGTSTEYNAKFIKFEILRKLGDRERIVSEFHKEVNAILDLPETKPLIREAIQFIAITQSHLPASEKQKDYLQHLEYFMEQSEIYDIYLHSSDIILEDYQKSLQRGLKGNWDADRLRQFVDFLDLKKSEGAIYSPEVSEFDRQMLQLNWETHVSQRMPQVMDGDATQKSVDQDQ